MENVIKDLEVREITNGYVEEEKGSIFRCIFCGETFEKGIIYTSRGRSVDAERAAAEHVYDMHNGPFESLVSLDKQFNGLTDIQKKLLTYMYEGLDNKEISRELDINTATVRTHKFKIQKMKREAKILLALLEFIENEDIMVADMKLSNSDKKKHQIYLEEIRGTFTGNTLHPFFTQFDLK